MALQGSEQAPYTKRGSNQEQGLLPWFSRAMCKIEKTCTEHIKGKKLRI